MSREFSSSSAILARVSWRRPSLGFCLCALHSPLSDTQESMISATVLQLAEKLQWLRTALTWFSFRKRSANEFDSSGSFSSSRSIVSAAYDKKIEASISELVTATGCSEMLTASFTNKHVCSSLTTLLGSRMPTLKSCCFRVNTGMSSSELTWH